MVGKFPKIKNKGYVNIDTDSGMALAERTHVLEVGVPAVYLLDRVNKLPKKVCAGEEECVWKSAHEISTAVRRLLRKLAPPAAGSFFKKLAAPDL